MNSDLSLTPRYIDTTDRLVGTFRQTSQAEGALAITKELVCGFFGTFISPFSEDAGRAMCSDAIHRADLTSSYSLVGFRNKLAAETVEVAQLKAQLLSEEDPSAKAALTKKLLLKKEQLTETKRDIIDRKCHVLARMRGYFGERDVNEGDAQLIEEIEAEHIELLKDFDSLSNILEEIRQEMVDNKVQRWMFKGPFEIIPRERGDIEREMELAQHPWMRKGALAFLKEHLNMDSIDGDAVERALSGLNGMFGKAVGTNLKAGDLQQMIRAMEKAIEEKGDADGSMSSALIALKGLVADAVLEHPDEIRRVLSLATFIFVGSMTGGVDGMLTAGFAKTIADRFLSQILPAPRADMPETGFSQMLRVVEAGVVFASGGAGALGTFAASELAHHLVPEEAKPMLIFGAAHFGLGAGAAAAAGITLIADLPLTTVSTVTKTARLTLMIRNPRKIPGAIAKELRSSFAKIEEAAKEKRYEELALRVSAYVIPAIFLATLLVWAMLPLLAAGTVATVAVSATMTITGFLSAGAIIAVLKLSEKQKKAAMIATLNAWRDDYYLKFPDPAQRDQGVLAVFEAMEEAIEEGRKLTKREFLELLKEHVPSFQDRSIDELEEALDKVAGKLDVDTASASAIALGESPLDAAAAA